MTTSVSVTATNRVVALVDMDCFYVQVEERDDPSIKGVPAAVVQYKAYKGGGIIAVNYEARAKGVTRNMRGDDAKAVCPEIILVRVPENRGKADLTKYRDAGREVINVLTDFSACVERASIDEAYIDLTEAVENRLAEINSQDMFASWSENVIESLNKECLSTNFVLGYDSTRDWLDGLKQSELPNLDDFKLAVGAEIVGKMREAVYQRTNFRCSAGIAHNKVLAKLVCGINKPNKQTILPHESVATLWSTTKIGKVRGLGGKLGEYIEGLGCVHMSDLKKFTEKELGNVVGSKTGSWLYQLSLGFDDEAVTPRQLPKSIGCNKNFNGPEALRTKEKVKFWINQLSTEVVERIQRDLEMNNRRAKTLTLHVKFENQGALSRSCGIPYYNAERMAGDVYSVMDKLYQSLGVIPINSLGLIASKFEDELDTTGNSKINDFFKAKSSSTATVSKSEEIDKNSVTDLGKPDGKQYPSSSTSHTLSDSNKGSRENLPETGCSTIDLPTAKTMDNESNTEKVTTSSLSTLRVVKNSTPTKTAPADADARKPFFTFNKTAPLSSPRKTPTKTANAISSLPSVHKDLSANKDFIEANASLLKECERCGKKIPEWDVVSHMDYHYAKDLSRELNGLPAVNVNTIPEPSKGKVDDESNSKSGQKRPRGRGALTMGSKRGRGASKASSVPSSSRTIDSYFASKS